MSPYVNSRGPGYNVFAREGGKVDSPEEQIRRVKLAASYVADLIEDEFNVVVTLMNRRQGSWLRGLVIT